MHFSSHGTRLLCCVCKMSWDISEACMGAGLCCRYYTEEMHRAAFVLPKYARDSLSGSLTL